MRGHQLSILGFLVCSLLASGPGSAELLPPARPELLDLPLPPDVPVLSGLSFLLPAGRSLYFPMVAAEANGRELPAEVADAVMRVESGYNPNAVGGAGERGLMQVMPATAALLGHRGSLDELADPATNIRLGVRYLAVAWRLAGGDLCRALMKYRAGHNEERMSALSVEYCRRAKAHLAAIGSPLGAGALPARDFGTERVRTTALATTSPMSNAKERSSPRAGRGRRASPGRTALRGNRFWAAHTARIRAIEARLPWMRDRIMAGG